MLGGVSTSTGRRGTLKADTAIGWRRSSSHARVETFVSFSSAVVTRFSTKAFLAISAFSRCTLGEVSLDRWRERHFEVGVGTIFSRLALFASCVRLRLIHHRAALLAVNRPLPATLICNAGTRRSLAPLPAVVANLPSPAGSFHPPPPHHRYLALLSPPPPLSLPPLSLRPPRLPPNIFYPQHAPPFPANNLPVPRPWPDEVAPLACHRPPPR